MCFVSVCLHGVSNVFVSSVLCVSSMFGVSSVLCVHLVLCTVLCIPVWLACSNDVSCLFLLCVLYVYLSSMF